MLFQVTKVVGGLLMPVSLVILLLLSGLLLLRSQRFRRLGAGLIAVGTGVLLLVSIPPFPDLFLAGLENRYPVLIDPPEAEWIVVLGGGSRGPETWPAADRLGTSSLYRLAEGVRLARRLRDARLITSGGAAPAGATTAELMAVVAREWGIDDDRIVVQTSPRNTEEEAMAVAERIDRGDRVILVTSALHMPRAVALFRGRGVDVVPAPTGHLASSGPRIEDMGDFLPSAGGVGLVERALWERLGLAWAGLRGRTGR